MVLCFDQGMCIRRVAKAWLAGWPGLFYYGSIPGYETHGWLERKRLDHVALWYLLGLPQFRCAVLSLIAVQLLVLSLAWHWDLYGWRRDLLRASPALFVLPWFASARRFAIVKMLRKPDR
jgi:hypothetical protein